MRAHAPALRALFVQVVTAAAEATQPSGRWLLTTHAAAVYALLVDHANARGGWIAWPSQEGMARRLGLTPRTVWSHLTRLLALGLVREVRDDCPQYRSRTFFVPALLDAEIARDLDAITETRGASSTENLPGSAENLPGFFSGERTQKLSASGSNSGSFLPLEPVGETQNARAPGYALASGADPGKFRLTPSPDPGKFPTRRERGARASALWQARASEPGGATRGDAQARRKDAPSRPLVAAALHRAAPEERPAPAPSTRPHRASTPVTRAALPPALGDMLASPERFDWRSAVAWNTAPRPQAAHRGKEHD